MPDPANPIVLDMAFERLQFETGFDVRAVIAERDRWKEIAGLRLEEIQGYQRALESGDRYVA